jgi:hypothetical protein
MRVLMAIVILAGSLVAPYATAEPPRKNKRIAKTHRTAQPRAYTREQVECERAQHEDPTGLYAAYPCWARETFGRGTRGDGIRWD